MTHQIIPAVLLWSALTITTTASGIELVQNGSFEVGASHLDPLTGDWNDGVGSTNDIGVLTVWYPYFSDGESVIGYTSFELPGIPETGYIRPSGAGEFFATQWGIGNREPGSGFLGSASQIIDLTSHAGKDYDFSAWLASRVPDDTDYAVVSAEFFAGPDATGDSLGSVTLDGNDQSSPFIVGSLTLDGLPDPSIPATQDNWTLYRAHGTIPPLAASAIVTIRGETVTGSATEGGYVDLVSLQVIPEPSSAVLACVLGAVGVVWWVRRKSGAPRA